MVEAVYRGELITLRSLLLCSAAGEVEMPCQILITKPGLAGLPIGFGEQPAIRTLADGQNEREDLDWKSTLTLQERGRPPTSRSHRILESPSDGSARQSAHDDT